jgi:predicted ester cyclase
MTASTKLQSSSLTDQEIRSIEMIYQAFNDRNPDLLDKACTEDWEDIPLAPGQGPGPDGLKKLIPMFLKAFPDAKIVVQEIVGASGRAAVRAGFSGTHSGEIFGIAGSGKTVDVALHDFHHLKNGRVARTWHLEDWFGMLHQVGVWPPRKP